ncbi:hypothetical protein HG536_0F03380 [Torulaspora globosa]|uniref:RRM domain-containing protein n=1 Tax=Torulaspora globosa TaxID=48254 RepID=A0A7G3ZKH7_9SACH|nr:uncharacterized protein HG536_0F03380 [Torulaspora globosa]QLL34013.1 hypothetical protein HG536_0F03380 [Torulaspora globosa]
MNQIRAIQKINEAELNNGILSSHLSWHDEYKRQAYIFIGGLNTELIEGDILTVFAQYGVPVDVCLVRDRETGDSKGFAYLKYEDQRSTVLAIDNLNGIKLAGRVIKVDHAWYTPRDDLSQYREAVKKELDKDKVIVPEDRHVKATQEMTNELEDPMQNV